VRVHKPADKKIKNSKRRTDGHKKGSKEREGKEYLFKTYKAIRWAYRQANLRGRFVSEHCKGFISAPHFPPAFDPWKRRLFRTKEKRID
jgi:hypothetical protein